MKPAARSPRGHDSGNARADDSDDLILADLLPELDRRRLSRAIAGPVSLLGCEDGYAVLVKAAADLAAQLLTESTHRPRHDWQAPDGQGEMAKDHTITCCDN